MSLISLGEAATEAGMRKLVYQVAVSLDGFIAGPGEALDWLVWSEDAAAVAGDLWQDADAILMGRRTYDFALKSGGGGDDPGGITTYVFSRTLAAAPPGAELVADDAATFVRKLKAAAGGKIILMGGGLLAGALAEAGLIDEVVLNIHPVILGGGTPVFGHIRSKVALGVQQARILSSGCAVLTFTPSQPGVQQTGC
jgi:dihydrofolate reductase